MRVLLIDWRNPTRLAQSLAQSFDEVHEVGADEPGCRAMAQCLEAFEGILEMRIQATQTDGHVRLGYDRVTPEAIDGIDFRQMPETKIVLDIWAMDDTPLSIQGVTQLARTLKHATGARIVVPGLIEDEEEELTLEAEEDFDVPFDADEDDEDDIPLPQLLPIAAGHQFGNDAATKPTQVVPDGPVRFLP